MIRAVVEGCGDGVVVVWVGGEEEGGGVEGTGWRGGWMARAVMTIVDRVPDMDVTWVVEGKVWVEVVRVPEMVLMKARVNGRGVGGGCSQGLGGQGASYDGGVCLSRDGCVYRCWDAVDSGYDLGWTAAVGEGAG